jgi:hypothetical protein
MYDVLPYNIPGPAGQFYQEENGFTEIQNGGDDNSLPFCAELYRRYHVIPKSNLPLSILEQKFSGSCWKKFMEKYNFSVQDVSSGCWGQNVRDILDKNTGSRPIAKIVLMLKSFERCDCYIPGVSSRYAYFTDMFNEIYVSIANEVIEANFVSVVPNSLFVLRNVPLIVHSRFHKQLVICLENIEEIFPPDDKGEVNCWTKGKKKKKKENVHNRLLCCPQDIFLLDKEEDSDDKRPFLLSSSTKKASILENGDISMKNNKDKEGNKECDDFSFEDDDFCGANKGIKIKDTEKSNIDELQSNRSRNDISGKSLPAVAQKSPVSPSGLSMFASKNVHMFLSSFFVFNVTHFFYEVQTYRQYSEALEFLRKITLFLRIKKKKRVIKRKMILCFLLLLTVLNFQKRVLKRVFSTAMRTSDLFEFPMHYLQNLKMRNFQTISKFQDRILLMGFLLFYYLLWLPIFLSSE